MNQDIDTQRILPGLRHRTRGRTLRACGNCGASCATSPCPRCAPATAPSYSSSEYQRNRRTVLANATTCALCGGKPTADDPLTCDHIRPRTAGGTDQLDNLQAAHESCNKSRGATFRGGVA